MSSLPGEVLIDIFVALPGKSILSCKCVCKFWRYIISSPKFVKYHLNNNAGVRNKNPKLIFVDSCMRICSIYYAFMSLSKHDHDCEVAQMAYPFEKDFDFVQVLGSCNGLICLSHSTLRGSSRDIIFCVWNPLTREYKKISLQHCESVTSPKWINARYGFGYDSVNDDYKLVIICEHAGCWRIQVYTLGSDSWNNTQSIPYSFPDRNRFLGVQLNGGLHWIGTSGETSTGVIVSFNIANHRISDLPLPEEIMQLRLIGRYKKNVYTYKCVGVLGERLCLLAVAQQSTQIDMHVWVMQNYGAKESWTKQFKVDNIDKYFRNYYDYSHYWKPIWKSQNGEILMDDARQFVLCDPAGNIMPKRLSKGSSFCENECESENYAESLVSLNSGTYVDFKHKGNSL